MRWIWRTARPSRRTAYSDRRRNGNRGPRLVLDAIPEAEIVATDLNQAMLDVAADHIQSAPGRLPGSDAQQSHCRSRLVDARRAQFGVMVFPDRPATFGEARRELKPGGRFLFNVWDRLEENPASRRDECVAALFPENPPVSSSGSRFGYRTYRSRVEAALRFLEVRGFVAETVRKSSRMLRRAMRPSALPRDSAAVGNATHASRGRPRPGDRRPNRSAFSPGRRRRRVDDAGDPRESLIRTADSGLTPAFAGVTVR